ncbi:MAG: nitrilase family protein [Ferruginibacter sp.]
MPPLTIATIQTNLDWENKAANLQRLEQKINDIGEKSEIVVLPEMFSTGFTMRPEVLAETMEGETVQWMKEIAAKNKIILTGSLAIKEEGRYYNRLIWMLPNGQMGYYDKRHLFGFAEEDKHYSAGNKRLIASVKGWKINLQVCYDLRFPVWARNRIIPKENPVQNSTMTENEESLTETRPEYDILIYVANWPERRNHAWKTLLCARAIENQCYVVGVNRVGRDGNNINHSGNSLIIDPLGEVLYHIADEEDVFTITLQKEQLEEVRAKFPFWKDGDDFSLH